MVRLFGPVRHGHHLQLHEIAALQGIGAEGGVTGVVEVIAVVAHQGFYARLFVGEVHHAKRIALFKEPFLVVGAQQAVHWGRVVQVGNGVEAEQFAGPHVVAHLGLLGIFLRQDLVIHFPVEETIVVECVGGHFGAHLRTYLAEQYRFAAEGAVYPLAYFPFAVVKAVVYPQSDFPRPAHARRAEHGVVGRIGQHGLHFFLRHFKVGFVFCPGYFHGLLLLFGQSLRLDFQAVDAERLFPFQGIIDGSKGVGHGGDDTGGVIALVLSHLCRVVLVGDFLDSRVELLVVGQCPRGGAGGEQEGGYDDNEA